MPAPSNQPPRSSFYLPRTQAESPFPQFPPSWADVFGEDDQGIFSEIKNPNLPFELRWILPQSWTPTGATTPLALTSGVWIADKVIPAPEGGWSLDLVEAYIAKCRSEIPSCNIRLPREIELLAAANSNPEIASAPRAREFCVGILSAQEAFALVSFQPQGLPIHIVANREDRFEAAVLRIAIERK